MIAHAIANVTLSKIESILEQNEDDEKAQEIIEKCDAVFFENEEKINHILQEFSNTIEL